MNTYYSKMLLDAAQALRDQYDPKDRQGNQARQALCNVLNEEHTRVATIARANAQGEGINKIAAYGRLLLSY